MAGSAHFDIVQVEQPWAILSGMLARTLEHSILVLDEHNVETRVSKSASAIPFAAPYVFAIEQIALKKSDHCLTVSELDKLRLVRTFHLSAEKVHVVPNGVNCERFQAIGRHSARAELGFSQDAKLIIFHGPLTWKPNAEAAEHIVREIGPRIHKRFPSAIFIIAGAMPPKSLLSLTRDRTYIRVVGYVRNLPLLLRACDLAIVPLRSGGGTRLKILEYFASELPVVTTTLGIEGLPARSGDGALVCERLGDDFIDLIIRTLADAELSKKLGAKGLEIARGLDWNKIGRRLAELYKRLQCCWPAK
jgi:glycosyltransferase involved in cell wall biosynthesis